MITSIDQRPRVFAWVRNRNAAGKRPDPQPQIIFTDPRVGCSGIEIVAEYLLSERDYSKSLHELAADPRFSVPPIIDRLIADRQREAS